MTLGIRDWGFAAKADLTIHNESTSLKVSKSGEEPPQEEPPHEVEHEESEDEV